jgi:hypothetical protein
MDEHRAREEFRFTNRKGHNPIRKQLLNKASDDEEELENEENRESEIINLSFSEIEKTFLETKIDEAWVISLLTNSLKG